MAVATSSWPPVRVEKGTVMGPEALASFTFGKL
jgi:hypothetical protein